MSVLPLVYGHLTQVLHLKHWLKNHWPRHLFKHTESNLLWVYDKANSPCLKTGDIPIISDIQPYLGLELLHAKNLRCESEMYTFWNITMLQHCIRILEQSPDDRSLTMLQCYVTHVPGWGTCCMSALSLYIESKNSTIYCTIWCWFSRCILYTNLISILQGCCQNLWSVIAMNINSTHREFTEGGKQMLNHQIHLTIIKTWYQTYFPCQTH